MKVIVFVKATKESEAGMMPDEKVIAAQVGGDAAPPHRRAARDLRRRAPARRAARIRVDAISVGRYRTAP
ncbi:hypothetical protein WME97_22875 [Sorangium sp. So ce367]|uniref:hypothetical protein n=1 Tax=Sorangium sp. So ce367 TaxID=3133305 RepID=UPI003F5F800D